MKYVQTCLPHSISSDSSEQSLISSQRYCFHIHCPLLHLNSEGKHANFWLHSSLLSMHVLVMLQNLSVKRHVVDEISITIIQRIFFHIVSTVSDISEWTSYLKGIYGNFSANFKDEQYVLPFRSTLIKRT